MRVLVGCEESATVRDAFRDAGHDAWSCDLIPTRGDPRWHYQRDVLEVIGYGWDLGIFHPPCTYLANSGSHWLFQRAANGYMSLNEPRWDALKQAAQFFCDLYNADIPRVAVENPWPHKWAAQIIGKPTFSLQPYEHGHRQKKQTCFWLRNLPPLLPTEMVGPPPPSGSEEAKAWEAVWREPPGPYQKRNRSKTFAGVARAMVQQWGTR